MIELLNSLRKTDPFFRTEFSGLAKGKVLCWLCYKGGKDGKEILTGTASGRDHTEALKNAFDGATV